MSVQNVELKDNRLDAFWTGFAQNVIFGQKMANAKTETAGKSRVILVLTFLLVPLEV